MNVLGSSDSIKIRFTTISILLSDTGIGWPPPAIDCTDPSRCSTCHDLVPQKEDKFSGERYLILIVQYSQLQKSADDGCIPCGVLREGYEYFATRSHGMDADHEIYISNEVVDGPIRDDGLMLHSYSLQPPLALMFHVREGEICPWECIGASSWSTARPTLEQVTALIHKNLEQCSNSHLECSASPSVPDRVLDLANFDQAADKGPVLIDSAERYQKDPEDSMLYLALSHCWGAQKRIETTKATCALYRKSIRWSDLPKTFQDAILIAQSLGIRYMWIDSLCIVQDDPDDWAKQASEMAMIYEHAHITLCATGSANGETGLLLDRPEVHSIKTVGSSTKVTIFARQMKRGWILQEQILSRRAVLFTKEELMWDCRVTLSCECKKYSLLGTDTFKQNVLRGLRDPGEAGTKWYEILQQYVQRIFTKDRDRLPALSGLAQMFELITNGKLGTYHAGMWENTLLDGLMWFTTQPGRRPIKPDNQEFKSSTPSWSWAAIESSHTQWPPYHKTLLEYGPAAEVLRVSTHPSTADAKGILHGGHLWLRGQVLPLRLEWSESEFVPDKIASRTNYQLKSFTDGSCLAINDGTHQGGLESFYPDAPLDNELSSGCTVFFLHLANVVVSPNPLTPWPNGIFMVESGELEARERPDFLDIEASVQTVTRSFRRIGCGRLLPQSGAAAALETCPHETLLIT